MFYLQFIKFKIKIAYMFLQAHCRLTVHPSLYYVGIVNPRRDTHHIVTEKDEPYEVEVVVVDYGT